MYYPEDRKRDVISAGTIVALIIALVFLGTWLFKALPCQPGASTMVRSWSVELNQSVREHVRPMV